MSPESEHLKVEQTIHSWTLLLVLILVFLEAGFFYYYGLLRHFNFLTSINDLGHFDQAVWGFLVGKPFYNTDIFSIPINRMGIHFDPVLALFVPLYYFLPSVKWLILAQSVALPLASIPIYYLSLRVTQSSLTSLLWACIYLFSPFVLSAASWDFHPVALAVPAIALGYLALETKKFKFLLASCLFILLCKEHFGLLVVGFGIAWALKHKEIKSGLLLVLVGAGHFVLVVKFIMPAFSPTGKHLMFAKDLGQLSRYSWLGNSLEEILITLVTNPIKVFNQVFITMNGWSYLALLLLPVFFLSVFGLMYLIPGMADLMANILSMNPMPRSVFAYHSVTLIPIFVIAAIYGYKKLNQRFNYTITNKVLIVCMLITILFSWKYFPFFPIVGGNGFWNPKRLTIHNDENYKTIQELIPEEMSISVQANLGAHFTNRERIFTYPAKVNEVDAVVLYLDSPTKNLNNHDPHRVGSLAHHLQMNPINYLNSIEDLLKDATFEKIVWLDPWLIFTKGEKTHNVNNVDITRKLDELNSEWQ